jgi:VWFA-related protein
MSARRFMRAPRAALLTGLLALATVGSVAATPADERVALPAPLQEVEKVRLVLLPTVVKTPGGRPVQGLEASDFSLFEDGIPQEISVFSTEDDAPVFLVFLLDLSTSMRLRAQLDDSKWAIGTFLADADPDDRFGLIGFADDQVDWITEPTAERSVFLRRLAVQEAQGQTALYDAMAASPLLVDERAEGRRAIVLLTDGLDNASELPRLKASQLARRVHVPIYAVTFIPYDVAMLPRRIGDSLKSLDVFVSETGGALFPVHDREDVQRAVASIQSEIRFQYVIGYYPTPRVWDGAFRRVELRTDRKRLDVRTRRGYYAKP